MGLLNKAMGRAEVNEDVDYVRQYFSEGEEVIQSFHFFRDELILTNYGIYFMDVQGLTGKKVEVRFVPRTDIANVSFETAGRLDFDVDIKIGLKYGFLGNKTTMIPLQGSKITNRRSKRDCKTGQDTLSASG